MTNFRIGEFLLYSSLPTSMITSAITTPLILGAELTALAQAGFAEVQDQMLPIPGGAFTMGYDATIHVDEKPAHRVMVSSFEMSKNTVTNAQYRGWEESLGLRRFFLVGMEPETGWPKVMAMGTKEAVEQYQAGLIAEAGGLQVWEVTPHNPDPGFDRPNQPANVLWNSAYLFAFMHGARLPTEAEYEFAATHGGTQRYATASGELEHWEIHTSFFGEKTATIDVDDPRYPDGPFGLRHLLGNVWEWSMNWFSNHYYEECYLRGTSVDPTGPVSGEAKAMRGASWADDNERALRPSYRAIHLSDTLNEVGFRLVRPWVRKLVTVS